MPIEFKEGGSGYSLGVEEELCIVDATTGELVPKIEEIMSRLPDGLVEFVSYELFQSVLEIKTPPCASAAEAERHLREMRGRVGSWAAACGAARLLGTHPFSLTATRRSPTRTLQAGNRDAPLDRQREVIFGQHVHVAVPGPEESIIAHNRLSEQTPLSGALGELSLLAGVRHGLESSRVKIFETFPRAGLPPAFPDYEAFEGYVDLMVASGAMEDYSYCWWDVRPHPRIGTIELRVLDSQTNLEYTTSLTALTQCLVAQALEEVGPHEAYDMHLATENKWRAAMHGMDAAFYNARDQTTIPARDLARGMVERLKHHAKDLNCENELEGVLDIVEGGTGSQRQREVYKESGNFLDVVAFLIEGTRRR